MKKILYVDDFPLALRALERTLVKVGYRVIAMTEPPGQEALDDIRPDLLLIDINMPQISGDDWVRNLKERLGISFPILLCSGLGEAEVKQRAEEAGADGYFCKSWGIKRLIEQIQERIGEDSTSPPAGLPSSPSSSASPGATPAASKIADPEDRGQCARKFPERIYNLFLEQNEARRTRVLSILRPDGPDGGRGTNILKPVLLELHDWIGESRMIGFEQLSAVARKLHDLLRSWGPEPIMEDQRTQFRVWFAQLSDISKQFGMDTQSSEHMNSLNRIRLEIDTELRERVLGRCATDEFVSLQGLPLLVLENQKRILLFDDNPVICQMLRRELEKRGQKVAVAVKHDEFQQLLAQFDPEIIFLDINMPEVNGEEVCREVRRTLPDDKKVIIIFFSSLTNKQLAELAASAGADGYISKRYGLDELTKYLDDLLQKMLP